SDRGWCAQSGSRSAEPRISRTTSLRTTNSPLAADRSRGGDCRAGVGARSPGRGAVQRAEITLEVAQVYAALFRWVDAVDTIERGLAELGQTDETLIARLQGELVICGLHDARRASRVKPVLEHVSASSFVQTHTEALAARGMAMVLAGRPAQEAAVPLEVAL